MSKPELKKIPDFKTGDIVKIIATDDIFKTLNSERKCDGLLFTDQMQNYCGSTFKILRAVNTVFNEHRQRSFKTKSTFYILENLICDGKADNLPHKCDHSCFLLWHKRWLEKI
jgi:hypothetical protein